MNKITFIRTHAPAIPNDNGVFFSITDWVALNQVFHSTDTLCIDFKGNELICGEAYATFLVRSFDTPDTYIAIKI